MTIDTPRSRLQQTLGAAVETRGVGLHSGALITARLCPHPGLVFVRTDLPGQPRVAAAYRCVASTTHATTLEANGARISTTEHLLAALWALGVTNCRIELDGPEVPILDGSAAGWCELITEAGVVPTSRIRSAFPEEAQASTYQRPLYTLKEPVWVSKGDGSLLGLPHDGFRLTVGVEYDVDYVRPQTFDLVVTPHSFQHELAPARTFTLEKWIAPLQALGLIRGGSTDNAIVLGATGPSSPWRFEDELARHKALDVVGDVALLCGADGGILNAHLIAIRAGHGLHRRWMEECLRREVLCKQVN